METGSTHDDGLWIAEVVGQEEISVPGLSSPQDTCKIFVIGTRENDYTVVGNYWILPGWGIVKSHLNASGWILDARAIERIEKSQ